MKSQVGIEMLEVADAGFGPLQLVHGVGDGRMWLALGYARWICRAYGGWKPNKRFTYSCARGFEAASSVT
jgi:hypothetical protein